VATARKTPFNAVKADAPLYQSRIELRDLEPAIWRQILLPASVKLPKLHVALLWTIGWAGGHLHEFVIGRRHFGEPNPDFDSGPPVQSEDRFTLTAALGVSKSFTYLYDFGDGWQHHVVVEKILSSDLALKLPVCLGGANACRKEDVGTPPGYVDFLQAINDPAHEEHDNISNGAADRSTPNFRLDHINTFLHQATPFFTRSNSNRQCGLRMTLT